LSSTSLTKARQNRPNAFCPASSAFFKSCLYFRSTILHLKFEKHSKQPQDTFPQSDFAGFSRRYAKIYGIRFSEESQQTAIWESQVLSMKAFIRTVRNNWVPREFFMLLVIANVFSVVLVRMSDAQEFGGSPPWGLEKPIHISGVVHAGETFRDAIGGGLSLFIIANRDSFKIGISGKDGDDLTRCVTPPFHGPNPTEIMAWHFRKNSSSPGGIGQKRWFQYVLTSEDHQIECRNLEDMLYNKNALTQRQAGKEWGARTSGSGWLQITGIKLSDETLGEDPSILSMSFEAECTLYGALQPWILPATYIIADDFTGWIAVYHREKGASQLPVAKNRYTVRINRSAAVHTSSSLRTDLRGAHFVTMNQMPIPIEGSARGIRCYQNWSIGDSSGDHFIQSFFVGTPDALKELPHSPFHPSGDDCSD
jgi:hypothetical protein